MYTALALAYNMCIELKMVQKNEQNGFSSAKSIKLFWVKSFFDPKFTRLLHLLCFASLFNPSLINVGSSPRYHSNLTHDPTTSCLHFLYIVRDQQIQSKYSSFQRAFRTAPGHTKHITCEAHLNRLTITKTKNIKNELVTEGS